MSGSTSSFQLAVLLGAVVLVGCAVSDSSLFGQSDAAAGGSSAGGASSGGSSGFGATAGVGGSGIGGAGGSVDGGGSGGSGGTGTGGTATGGAGSGGVGGSGGAGGLGGAATGGTGGGASNGDCCSPQTTPGCANTTIKNCVCAKDAFCCSKVWDTGCVSEVKTLGCGNCGTGGSGGTGGFGGTGGLGGTSGFGGTGGTSGDCCVVHSTPSCSVPSVAACVCAADSYCCQIDWDSICVGEVTSMGCGTC